MGEIEGQTTTLRKIDDSINIVTTTETVSVITVAEYDRQIEEAENRLISLKSGRQAIIYFDASDETETEIEL